MLLKKNFCWQKKKFLGKNINIKIDKVENSL